MFYVGLLIVRLCFISDKLLIYSAIQLNIVLKTSLFIKLIYLHSYTHTHTRLTALFQGLPG